MARQLEQPILDDGTRFVHFFEGRILSGEDLRDEQKADREQRRQLGRGLGAGVVEGLQVRQDDPGSEVASPVLAVSAGLAVNGLGETIALSQEQKLDLVRDLDTAADGSGDLFGPCATQPPGTQLPNGVGFYVLTVAPASGFELDAPKSGLGDGGAAAGCGRRYNTLGVQFRLVKFDPTTVTGVSPALAAEIAALSVLTDPRSRSLLRNLVAHLCLGTLETRSHPADPWLLDAGEPAFARYGVLDDLRAGDSPALTRCEVPVAVLSWTAAGIGFLDLWSVRRRPTVAPPSAAWPLIAAPRRRAEVEAALFQFQAQLADLRERLTASERAALQVARYFRFLPPVGLVPLSPGTPPGFVRTIFFQGVATEGPLTIAGARMNHVLEQALDFGPVDLSATLSPGAVGLCLFETAENLQVGSGGQRFAIFTAGVVPSFDKLEAKCRALEERVEALEEAAAAATRGAMEGTVRIVYNFGSGSVSNPWPDIPVQVTSDATGDSSTVNTDPQGQYRFDGLEAGSYRVSVAGGGFSALERSAQVVVAGETLAVNFNINLQSLTTGLNGTLVDDSGAAVAGTQVRAVNAATGETATAYTGADGSYLIANLPPGDYRVEVVREEGAPQVARDVSVDAGAGVTLPITLRRGGPR